MRTASDAYLLLLVMELFGWRAFTNRREVGGLAGFTPTPYQSGLTGTLRSTPVDLFARRTLRWVQTRLGAWVLSLGAQHGTLRPDGPETWQVVQVRRDAEPVQLGDTLPLPYAEGLAEDYVRHLGVARLVEAEAPWRQHPATEKQTALLRKLGIVAQAGLTKGEAAELLAAVLGDWD
jgi:hypothetical protein